MINRHATFTTALALSLASASHAIVTRADRTESQYTALAAQAQFAPVGRLLNGFPDQVSGILIAPTWVLTAAHCADIVDVHNMTFVVGGNNYSVDAKYIPSGWNTDPGNGYDLALLHLTAPVTNVTPAVRAAGGEIGAACTVVGFGQTGTGSSGAIAGTAGTKRACQNTFDALGSMFGWNAAILLFDFDEPNNPSRSTVGSATPADLEGGVAPGDSGGGTFILINNQWRLAGIHSFGATPAGAVANFGYGTLCGDTRISSYASWIDGIIGAACYANCDGSTTPPVLTVNDFICFQSRFASNDPYANCDGSTIAPVLTVNDFICFQSHVASGCP